MVGRQLEKTPPIVAQEYLANGVQVEVLSLSFVAGGDGESVECWIEQALMNEVGGKVPETTKPRIAGALNVVRHQTDGMFRRG